MPSSALHHHRRPGREDAAPRPAPRARARPRRRRRADRAARDRSAPPRRRVAGRRGPRRPRGCGASAVSPRLARFARSTARLRGARSMKTTLPGPAGKRLDPECAGARIEIEHARAVQIAEPREERLAHAIRGRTRSGRRRAQAPPPELASRHAHVRPLSRSSGATAACTSTSRSRAWILPHGRGLPSSDAQRGVSRRLPC